MHKISGLRIYSFLAVFSFLLCSPLTVAAQSISSFQLKLIDVNGNKELGDLTLNGNKSFPSFADKKITIEAKFSSTGKKERVKFLLSKINDKGKKSTVKKITETGAPWTLFSNNGSKYGGSKLKDGKYEVEVAVESLNGSSWKQEKKYKASFDLGAKSLSAPSDAGLKLTLLDTPNGSLIGTFAGSGTSMFPSQKGKKITIDAQLNKVGKKTRVTFIIYKIEANGKKTTLRKQLDSGAPYNLFGNSGKKLNGKEFGDGKYEVQVGIEAYNGKKWQAHSKHTFSFELGGSGGNIPSQVGTPRPVQTSTPVPTPTKGSTSGGGSSSKCNDRNLLGFTHLKSDFNSADKAASLLKNEMGSNAVRLWKTMQFNTPLTANDFEYPKAMKARGLKTVVVFTVPEKSGMIPTPDQIKTYFRQAVKQAAGSVDYWEIINEANHTNYWTGSMATYMNNVLKPASEVLRKENNECVLSTSITGSVAKVKELVNLGMLDYVDGVAYHSYRKSASQEIQMINEVVDLAKGKPVYLTEWNIIMPHSTKAEKDAWGNEAIKAYNGIKGKVAGVFFFNTIYHTGGHAGFSAPFTTSGGRTEYFCYVYSLFRGSVHKDCK